jgi:hypothetical protein
MWHPTPHFIPKVAGQLGGGYLHREALPRTQVPSFPDGQLIQFEPAAGVTGYDALPNVSGGDYGLLPISEWLFPVRMRATG